jgi:hypothetical protein
MVLPLAKTGSDHVPYVVHIDTEIPKAKLFRFENYWVDMPGFQQCVKESWAEVSHKTYSSAILADKLKTARYDLKKWQVSLSHLKLLIQNCNKVILALDSLEEHKPLFKAEFNFQRIVKLHLDELLLAECNYWRKRCTIRWNKQGEDNKKFFHFMATERFHRNNIAMSKNDDGVGLWRTYKCRMGQLEGIDLQFDLASLLTRVDGLEELTIHLRKNKWMR